MAFQVTGERIAFRNHLNDSMKKKNGASNLHDTQKSILETLKTLKSTYEEQYF